MERLVFEFAFRAGLIIITAALLLRVLRIRAASAQHAVWAGVLMTMLLLPAWMAWGPRASVPVLPARVQPAVVAFDLEVPVTPMPVQIPDAPVVRPRARNYSAMLLGIYLLGAATLLLRLVIGTLRANRLTSASCAAPVTVGFLRPRIVLPASSAEWSQEQLDAVLTHERAHVRRRDPLFQWLALLNRAAFWFHPLAWWLERKLSALAEEACDAAVLERGHDPRDYSRYLLELARVVQRAGTRVNVVAMAMPGSYLPQRVKNIIDGVRAPKISRTRLACAVLACAIPAAVFAAGTLDRVPQVLPLPLPAWTLPQPPVLIAQAAAPAPAKAPQAPAAKLEFEVASVRRVEQLTDISARGGRGGPGTSDPDRFTFGGLLAGALRIAYGVNFDQISGPEWLQTEKYEIAAKVPPGTTKEQMNVMLQNLLVERFQMSLHHVAKEFPEYELVIAKGGAKLKENTDANLAPSAPGDPRRAADRDGFPQIASGRSGMQSNFADGLTHLTARGVPLSGLLFMMGASLGSTTGPNTYAPARIADKTGLTGNYDFTLEFAGGFGIGGSSQVGPDAAGPDLIEAVEKQLGLKLQKTMASVDTLVIDHAEKVPTEN